MPDPILVEKARATALQLSESLIQRKTDRIVFAESCTAGLVSALMGQVPGISNWLCGSAVTYRESVKQKWLSVSSGTLRQHSPESAATTSEMAIGVLHQSEEATFSAAVTGHLGPGAPSKVDGLIFVSIASRSNDKIEILKNLEIKLESTKRVDRQYEAAINVLQALVSELSQ